MIQQGESRRAEARRRLGLLLELLMLLLLLRSSCTSAVSGGRGLLLLRLLLLLLKVELLLAVDVCNRHIFLINGAIEVDEVADAGQRNAHVGRDAEGRGILLRRVYLSRSDDVSYRVDDRCLYTTKARPVPVSPLGPPLKACVVALVDLAAVVVAAALGAQEVGATLKAARPEALARVPLPVLRLSIEDREVIPARDSASRAVWPLLKAWFAVRKERRSGMVCPALRKHV